MNYDIVQQIHPQTQLARLYLRVANRNIWVNQKVAETLRKVSCPSLEDLRVVRYQTLHKVMFYLEYENQSSLISSEDAAFILKAQGLLSPELMNKPAEFVAKTLISLTAKQVPYWIDNWWEDSDGDEYQAVPKHSESRYTQWFGVDYRGHRLAKYKTRPQAIQLMRALYELGQPTVQNGELVYETCGFRIRTLNWEIRKWEQPDYVNNPCRDFVHWESKSLRTQFENQCTQIIVAGCRALTLSHTSKNKYKKYATLAQALEMLSAVNAIGLPEIQKEEFQSSIVKVSETESSKRNPKNNKNLSTKKGKKRENKI